MKISVSDIKSTYINPDNNLGVVQYTLGNVQTPEIYNDGAIAFHPPGLISQPIGPGKFSGNTPNTFQSAITSTVSAKAIALQNGNLWHSFGIIDVRSAQLVTAGTGETCLFAEGLPSSQLAIDINGNLVMTNGMASIKIDQTNNVDVIVPSGQLINLGTATASDAAALASKVDLNFSTVSMAASIAAEAIMSTPPVTVAALAGVMLTFLQSLTFNPTASMVVKISE